MLKEKIRILPLLLAFIMALSLVACANNTPAKPTDASSGGQETKPVEDGIVQKDPTAKENMIALILQEGGLGDKGFNDGAAAGLARLKDTYGIESITVEPTDVSQGELIIREVAEEGYGLIIIMDYTVMTAVYDVCVDYPDQVFVPLGMPASWRAEGNFPNIVDSQFSLPEHTFLAGVAAAYAATDGNTLIDGVAQNPGAVIGCIFPTESTGFYRYFDAFCHGAKSYNPDIEIISDFTVGYTDSALCQTVAENMIKNQGADVIWTCCGTAGLGGLQACRMNNIFGIGVDSDQDDVEPGYILTSVIRDTGENVFLLGTLWMNDELLGQDEFIWGVADGILRLSDMEVLSQYVTNNENFEEMKSLLNTYKEQIENEEIEPFEFYDHDGQRFSEWWSNQ